MSQIFESNDVAKHNGQDGKPIWIIIKGSVYDVTQFLNQHPGGNELVIEWAGKDATKAFNNVGHSSNAVKDLNKYKIGELVITSAKVNEVAHSAPIQESSFYHVEQESDTSKSTFCCCLNLN